MSQADAELFFEGRIPPGAIDPRAVSKFTNLANAVRQGDLTEKPGHVLARMAAVAETYLLRGALTEGDLARAGFSAPEIATHQANALKLALLANPTLQTCEWAA